MRIKITSAEIKDHLGVQVNIISSLLSKPDPFLAPCIIECLKHVSALPVEIEREASAQFVFSRLYKLIDCIEAEPEKILIYTAEKVVEVTAEDLKQLIAKRYPQLELEENLAGLLLSQCSSTIEDFLKKALKKEGRETFSGTRAKRPFMRKHIRKMLAEPDKIEIDVKD